MCYKDIGEEAFQETHQRKANEIIYTTCQQVIFP